MHAQPFFVAGIGGMKVSGAEPLPGATICLHGGPGGNSLTLYPFFPAERIQGDWYFADLPNHGRSDSTGGDWSPEACLAMLERFASTLQGPLRVAGLSWGANVALRWATTHPSRFSGFVGISGARDLQAVIAYQSQVIATMPPWLLALMERAATAEGKEAAYLSNRIYIETLAYWMRDNPGLTTYREKTLEFTPNPSANAGYMEHWLQPELTAAHVHDQLMQLQRAAIPALLIWGEDDRMGDAPCAMAHGAEDTGAQLLVIDNAGHCPFVDQPDRFFPAVRAFFHEL